MAVPSIVFFALYLTGLAGVVLLIQHRYLPLRSTPEYLLVATFLPLFISCSIVVLVPIDLASNASLDHPSKGIVLPSRLLLVAWRIAYWLCFVLTWTILPLLISYSDSGHRDPKKRFLAALHANARYYAILVSLGSLGLIYFLFAAGLNFTSLKGLIMALSHSYALSLAIFLMGHGLVAIPRELYHYASISGRLRRLQKRAPRAYDKLLDATHTLESIESEVSILSQRRNSVGSASEFKDWISTLSTSLSLPESALSNPNSTSRSKVPQVITEPYLASITSRLNLALHRQSRYTRAWESLIQSAANAQAILDSRLTKRLTFIHHFPSTTPSSTIPQILNPYTRHILHLYLIPFFSLLSSILLAAASIVIIWTECVHTLSPRLSLLPYTYLSSGRPSTIAHQLIAGAWLGYMILSAYHSLSIVKVWGTYALVPRLTSGSSAAFYSSYAARLTVPLAFNFVSMIPDKLADKESTVFYNFLGRLVNLTAISEGWNDYFPIVILIPVILAATNAYGRIGAWVGAGDVVDEEAEEEGGVGAWIEGRQLIERELQSAGRRRIGGTSREAGYGTAGVGRRPGGYRDQEPVDGEDEEEEVGYWGGLLHRVRNTVEGIEAPRWVREQVGAVRGGGSGGGRQQAAGRGTVREGGEERPRWWR